uniref:Uncharacterized protein n=1 Tax=Pristionchus pacificus TaxID=54126 RepID=A0A2A6B622_PRIPA|eukprot:PDM61335.1 hypothetical protein PRIPAC_50777 [Pristionchus pacificus]
MRIRAEARKRDKHAKSIKRKYTSAVTRYGIIVGGVKNSATRSGSLTNYRVDGIVSIAYPFISLVPLTQLYFFPVLLNAFLGRKPRRKYKIMKTAGETKV